MSQIFNAVRISCKETRGTASDSALFLCQPKTINIFLISPGKDVLWVFIRITPIVKSIHNVFSWRNKKNTFWIKKKSALTKAMQIKNNPTLMEKSEKKYIYIYIFIYI